MNGSKANLFYAFKSLTKASPFNFLFISLAISIIIPGYTLRISERPLIGASINNNDFSKLTNCYWYLVITLTTVGYGDYNAVSIMGRIISVIIMFWGMFIVSMFVLTLNNQIKFSKGEEKSFQLLNRLKQKEQLKSDAVKVLEQAFIKLRTEKSHPNNLKKLLTAVRNFRSRTL